MHPARPALPELHRLGRDEVAAPLVGYRHVAPSPNRASASAYAAIELVAARDDPDDW